MVQGVNTEGKHMSNQDDNAKKLQELGNCTYAALRELVEALDTAEENDDDEAREEAERAIDEDPLSVQVRSGWFAPGAALADRAPVEFEILLSTGGPATRIVGELNEHGEPCKARIECQDWFQPWTAWRLPVERESFADADAWLAEFDKADSILLRYCGRFWFGEGE
jgi:hypothetical protein